MAMKKDVESAVEALIELGVINEAGLVKLSGLFEALRAFTREPSSGRRKRRASGATLEREASMEPEQEDVRPEEEEEAGAVRSPAIDVDRSGAAEGDAEVSDRSTPPSRKGRGRPRSFNVTQAELQDLREAGMTIHQIAELRGVSPATVSRKLREGTPGGGE